MGAARATRRRAGEAVTRAGELLDPAVVGPRVLSPRRSSLAEQLQGVLLPAELLGSAEAVLTSPIEGAVEAGASEMGAGAGFAGLAGTVAGMAVPLPGGRVGRAARGLRRADRGEDLLRAERYMRVGGLTELDPLAEAQRTGFPGAERRRMLNAEPGTFRPRLNFYLEGTPAEPGIGQLPHRYRVQVPKSRVYDLGEDPLGLIEQGGGDLTAVENLIAERGFAGYTNPRSGLPGALVLFEKVPAEEVGAATAGGFQRLERPSPPRLELSVAERNRLAERLAGQLLRGGPEDEAVAAFLARHGGALGPAQAGQLLDRVLPRGRQLAEEELRAARAGFPSLARRRELVEGGRDLADWYERSRRALSERFGEPNVPVVARIAAATSANRPVRTNALNTLRVLRDVREGRPVDYLMSPHLFGVEQALRGEDLTGPKTGAFARALLGDPDAYVHDVWQNRAFGFFDPTKRGQAADLPIPDRRFGILGELARTEAPEMGLRGAAPYQASMWAGTKRDFARRGLLRRAEPEVPFDVVIEDLIRKHPDLAEAVARLREEALATGQSPLLGRSITRAPRGFTRLQ